MINASKTKWALETVKGAFRGGQVGFCLRRSRRGASERREAGVEWQRETVRRCAFPPRRRKEGGTSKQKPIWRKWLAFWGENFALPP